MNTTEPEFILAANSIAMALYRKSKEALMSSDCYDFMVFRHSGRNFILDGLEEWEESVSIDEATYDVLHCNLCTKLRTLYNTPKPDASFYI